MSQIVSFRCFGQLLLLYVVTDRQTDRQVLWRTMTKRAADMCMYVCVCCFFAVVLGFFGGGGGGGGDGGGGGGIFFYFVVIGIDGGAGSGGVCSYWWRECIVVGVAVVDDGVFL